MSDLQLAFSILIELVRRHGRHEDKCFVLHAYTPEQLMTFCAWDNGNVTCATQLRVFGVDTLVTLETRVNAALLVGIVKQALRAKGVTA